MRKKDYYELAKRSLRIRKKSTRATIIALAVGFALIIPVIVGLFGLNVSINDQLNKSPYSLYYETAISDYRLKTEDYVDSATLGTAQILAHISGSTHIDYLTDNTKSGRTIIYEQYPFCYGSDIQPFGISVGGGEYKALARTDQSYYSIIDTDKSDTIFPQNLIKHFDDGIFVNGYGQGFIDNGKKQVVLSERFVADNGYTAEELYLKTISINASQERRLSEGDPVGMEGYLCRDYTVVGVVKREVADMYNAYYGELMASDMFFTSVNVYDDNAMPVLKPHYNYYGEKNDEKYFAYDNMADKERLNEEFMMLGWGNSPSKHSNNYNRSTYGLTFVYGENDSYANVNKNIVGINSLFANKLGFKDDFAIVSMMFSNYQLVYNLANIVSVILVTISLVLGLTALINLFCSIKHSVRERKQYLTMMRAIGAVDRDVPRLYLLEAVIISSKASAIISIVGFALATAIKYLFEFVLIKNGITIALSIPWWTIIVTILASVVVVFGTCIVFSYACTQKLSKQKISTILNNN